MASRKTEQSVAIGRRIAEARQRQGMSQEELGDVVRVATRTVQLWEYGEHIPYKHMRRLEEVLEVAAGWLLHGEAANVAQGDQLEEMNKRLKLIETKLSDLSDMVREVLGERG